MKRIITYRADNPRSGLTLRDLQAITREAERLGDYLGKEVVVRVINPTTSRGAASGAIRELRHERGGL